jgi:hypothetical protein
MELPPHARAILSSPNVVARGLAGLEQDLQRRWMLRRPRAIRRSYVETVVDAGGDQERWMLLQDDETRHSYVREVLEREPDPDRQAIWLLGQPQSVRDSYIADVLDG